MREAEVQDLVRLHGEGGVDLEDLVQKGVLIHRPQTNEYAVRYSLGEYLREINQARRLVSSEWTRYQLQALERLLAAMEARITSVQTGSLGVWAGFNDDLFSLEKQVEGIRSVMDGNLEAIREQVGAYRKQTPGAFRDRYAWISRIWEEFILPVRGVFDPNGQWEHLAVAFEHVLTRVDELNAPTEILVRARWVSLGITVMIRAAQHTDREGSREVWPIYESVKSDGTIARDAAHLLEAARKAPRGAVRLNLDSYFGVADPWGEDRLIKPFDDLDLSRRLAEMLNLKPGPPPKLMDVSDVPLPVVITSDDVMERLIATGETPENALVWLQQAFPGVSLEAMLRAYGGLVLEGALDPGEGGPTSMLFDEVEIIAHPMGLENAL